MSQQTKEKLFIKMMLSPIYRKVDPAQVGQRVARAWHALNRTLDEIEEDESEIGERFAEMAAEIEHWQGKHDQSLSEVQQLNRKVFDLDQAVRTLTTEATDMNRREESIRAVELELQTRKDRFAANLDRAVRIRIALWEPGEKNKATRITLIQDKEGKWDLPWIMTTLKRRDPEIDPVNALTYAKLMFGEKSLNVKEFDLRRIPLIMGGDQEAVNAVFIGTGRLSDPALQNNPDSKRTWKNFTVRAVEKILVEKTQDFSLFFREYWKDIGLFVPQR